MTAVPASPLPARFAREAVNWTPQEPPSIDSENSIASTPAPQKHKMFEVTAKSRHSLTPHSKMKAPGTHGRGPLSALNLSQFNTEAAMASFQVDEASPSSFRVEAEPDDEYMPAPPQDTEVKAELEQTPAPQQDTEFQVELDLTPGRQQGTPGRMQEDAPSSGVPSTMSSGHVHSDEWSPIETVPQSDAKPETITHQKVCKTLQHGWLSSILQIDFGSERSSRSSRRASTLTSLTTDRADRADGQKASPWWKSSPRPERASRSSAASPKSSAEHDSKDGNESACPLTARQSDRAQKPDMVQEPDTVQEPDMGQEPVQSVRSTRTVGTSTPRCSANDTYQPVSLGSSTPRCSATDINQPVSMRSEPAPSPNRSMRSPVRRYRIVPRRRSAPPTSKPSVEVDHGAEEATRRTRINISKRGAWPHEPRGRDLPHLHTLSITRSDILRCDLFSRCGLQEQGSG